MWREVSPSTYLYNFNYGEINMIIYETKIKDASEVECDALAVVFDGIIPTDAADADAVLYKTSGGEVKLVLKEATPSK